MKHTKHTNLLKPKMGDFARNEWAFIGAPCDKIKELVTRITDNLDARILYVDESHNHSDAVRKLAVATKMGEGQEMRLSLPYNKLDNRINFNDFDLVLVNGNHFRAARQIVILDKAKEESLGRKLDRLTDVRAFISTDEIKEPYEFLRDGENVGTELPIIHISNIEAIIKLLKEDFKRPEIKALILAGGKSQRMGQDKAEINYHGKGQASYLYEMTQELGLESFISCRSEQKSKYNGLQIVEDKFVGLGPFGAIASAFMQDSNAAWLIVPCDLPLLEKENLSRLIAGRNALKFGTAFLNKETNFPEPLITIYEPKIYQRMLAFLAQGYSCPRKVLINSDVELLQVEDQKFMTNVNTPEEMRQASIIIEEK